MARDEFWLLSNNMTLLVWLKKNYWKMFKLFSSTDERTAGTAQMVEAYQNRTVI